MIGRALHMEIFVMDMLFKPTVIPNLSPVQFKKTVGQPIFTAHPDDTPALKINEIVYNSTTNKFRIITTPTTQNDFVIFWCLSLTTCNIRLMPTFTILVEHEDGSLYASFPCNGARKQDTLFSSIPLHLPTPTQEEKRVDYYISLINQTGGNCFYNLKTYQVAGILITSMDST